VALLGRGDCTIDLVAQHLGMTRRTIHRYLSAEGRTFSEIVDAVRRELAARYMKDKHRTLADVSAMLGFSAPSGFTRWYRRQFGTAPSERRAASPRRNRSKGSVLLRGATRRRCDRRALAPDHVVDGHPTRHFAKADPDLLAKQVADSGARIHEPQLHAPRLELALHFAEQA